MSSLLFLCSNSPLSQTLLFRSYAVIKRSTQYAVPLRTPRPAQLARPARASFFGSRTKTQDPRPKKTKKTKKTKTSQKIKKTKRPNDPTPSPRTQSLAKKTSRPKAQPKDPKPKLPFWFFGFIGSLFLGSLCGSRIKKTYESINLMSQHTL